MDNSIKTTRPGTSCAYVLGMLGAAVFYVSNAVGFWAGVLGILKAFVWPAFLVFEILQAVAA